MALFDAFEDDLDDVAARCAERRMPAFGAWP